MHDRLDASFRILTNLVRVQLAMGNELWDFALWEAEWEQHYLGHGIDSRVSLALSY